MLKFSNEHDQMSCKIPANVLFTHANAPDQTQRIKRFNKSINRNILTFTKQVVVEALQTL